MTGWRALAKAVYGNAGTGADQGERGEQARVPAGTERGPDGSRAEQDGDEGHGTGRL
jgi:hypothetical protein